MAEIYNMCKKVIEIQKRNLQIEVTYNTNITNITSSTLTYGTKIIHFIKGNMKVLEEGKEYRDSLIKLNQAILYEQRK